MFTEITIDGFQGIGTRQTIRLAPLTLIFGENSAGKSSVIRSLLFLAQSFTRTFNGLRATTVALDPEFSGRYIDLVGFKNVSFKHEGNPVCFKITNSDLETRPYHRPSFRSLVPLSQASTEIVIESPGEIKKLLFTGVSNGYEVKISLSKNSENEEGFIWNLDDFTITGNQDEFLKILKDYNLIRVFPGHFVKNTAAIEKKFAITKSALNKTVESLSGKSTFIWMGRFRANNLPQERIKPGSREKIDFSNLETLLSEFIADLLDFVLDRSTADLGLISHIKPIREIPERLSIAEVTKVQRPRNSRNSRIDTDSVVGDWVNKLTDGQFSLKKVVSTIDSEELEHLGQVSAWVLTDNRTGSAVSFKDVGVGLSQLLPVIYEVSLMDTINVRSKLLTIEQPELHLHPSLQGSVLDMLYEATSRAGVQHQVIAETHSEQMVLRLQRRIREKSIKSSEVSVIYVSAIPDSGSVFQELQFDENGVMDEWPRGFSDFRLEEILG